MVLSEQEKQSALNTITEMMITALKNDELFLDDGRKISQLVLGRFDAVQTKEDLIAFLEELSGTWLVFRDLLIVEKGQEKTEQEKSSAEEVLRLTKEGKIDEATELAKHTMNLKQS